MKQILRAKIYGDSIMKGTILDAGYRYHAIMNEYLIKLYDRFGIEAENRARFGITVKRGHSILLRDIDEGLDCELALVEFGGNDSDFKWSEISMEPDKKHMPLTSMADFKQNIAAMTEEPVSGEQFAGLCAIRDRYDAAEGLYDTLYSKADQETEAASMSAMVVFPLYYLALVLTMTAATILTVQQLSETDRYRG